MAFRYFVAPVIGTGTKADPYRLEVAVAGISYAAILPTGPTGAPVFGWGMARVSAADFAALDANSNVVGLPEGDMGVLTLGDLPANQRNRLTNWLSGRGVDMTGITNASTLAAILDRVGAFLGNNNWRALFTL